MLKRLLSLTKATKECSKELTRVAEQRAPVAAPIRRKIEERERKSTPPLVTNGKPAQ